MWDNQTKVLQSTGKHTDLGQQMVDSCDYKTQEWSPKVDGELYPNLLVLYLGSHVTSTEVPNLVQSCLPGETLPESNRWHVNTSIKYTHLSEDAARKGSQRG